MQHSRARESGDAGAYDRNATDAGIERDKRGGQEGIQVSSSREQWARGNVALQKGEVEKELDEEGARPWVKKALGERAEGRHSIASASA